MHRMRTAAGLALLLLAAALTLLTASDFDPKPIEPAAKG